MSCFIYHCQAVCGSAFLSSPFCRIIWLCLELIFMCALFTPWMNSFMHLAVRPIYLGCLLLWLRKSSLNWSFCNYTFVKSQELWEPSLTMKHRLMKIYPSRKEIACSWWVPGTLFYTIFAHQPCQHCLSQATTPSMNSGHHWRCMAKEHPFKGNYGASTN